MPKITTKNIQNFIAKTRRFGLFLPLSNVVLCYGGRFLSQKFLSRLAQRRHRIIEKKILEIVSLDDIDLSGCNQEVPADWKGKIWVMWLQGEAQMPDLVKTCYRSILKNSAGREVVLLTKDNVADYVTLSPVIWQKYNDGKISHAHFSDLVRMKLLAEHGGFWIDATIYLARPIPEEVFEMPYYTIKHSPEGNYVSECRWTGFFQWAKPNMHLSKIVTAIFDTYWDKEDVLLDYFFLDYAMDISVKRNRDVSEIFESLQYNNPHAYGLVGELLNTYNIQSYENMVTDTFAFKLDWKRYTDSELMSSSDSFYAKIKANVTQ